jgi:pantoate--beta-alanine ligase
MKSTHNPREIVRYVTDKINATPGIDLEYFEIVNGSTLLPVSTWEGEDNVTGCIAARVGKIRLIDNINFSL